MKYEKFINELKNIPTIKEKQDALDAINLSSKILFDINEKALESHSQKTSNDLKACLKTVEMIHDGIIEINTKIKQDKD